MWFQGIGTLPKNKALLSFTTGCSSQKLRTPQARTKTLGGSRLNTTHTSNRNPSKSRNHPHWVSSSPRAQVQKMLGCKTPHRIYPENKLLEKVLLKSSTKMTNWESRSEARVSWTQASSARRSSRRLSRVSNQESSPSKLNRARIRKQWEPGTQIWRQARLPRRKKIPATLSGSPNSQKTQAALPVILFRKMWNRMQKWMIQMRIVKRKSRKRRWRNGLRF